MRLGRMSAAPEKTDIPGVYKIKVISTKHYESGIIHVALPFSNHAAFIVKRIDVSFYEELFELTN